MYSFASNPQAMFEKSSKFLLILLILTLCIYKLAAKALIRRQCYYRGTREEQCLHESQTECGINSFGAPVGCVNASVCGSAANSEDLKCDQEKEMCCCKANEQSCNDYWEENFERLVLCEAFPNATVCLVDSEVFTQTECYLADRTLEQCKPPLKSACIVDTLGRPRGCKPFGACPTRTYYFDPQCDYEENFCCCMPLAEVICNDRTQSRELELLLREAEEKMKKEDTVAGTRSRFSFDYKQIMNFIAMVLIIYPGLIS